MTYSFLKNSRRLVLSELKSLPPSPPSYSYYLISLVLLFNMINCQETNRSMDLKTPRNVFLTAFYKRSFAYHTVKNRMPLILTQVIDGMARSKEEIGQEYGEVGKNELKQVIGELSKLKYEIQTNKPLRGLISIAPDVEFYNKYIQDLSNSEGNLTWFSTIWLLSECYMYRRIRETFELTSKLDAYDPFRKQKEISYEQALPIIVRLGQLLTDTLNKSVEANKEDLITFVKLNLWGNKCDLSLSNGVVNAETDTLFNLNHLSPNILCDHSEKIWEFLTTNSSEPDIIDIIFDNAGYELFTDLCLADYITTKKLAKKVRFYVKTIPWFISDVMINDFKWMLDELKNHENQNLKSLGEKWSRYVKHETWVLVQDDFWTLPIDYSQMAKVNPDLYKKLAEAKLAIFKGDLNYRKLFGEKNWDPTTPIDEALQDFNPTKLCSLRTIKADIVCGLDKGVAERTEAADQKWMETGNYGLIQTSEKIVPI